MTLKVLNQYRVRYGTLASDDSVGNCGAFEIPFTFYGGEHRLLKEMPPVMASKLDIHHTFFVIADDGRDSQWEHVSAHKIYMGNSYIPSWEDMCFLKDLFWDEEDCVVQYHPPKSEYINNHTHVLHLWRWAMGEMLMPPKILVGI